MAIEPGAFVGRPGAAFHLGVLEPFDMAIGIRDVHPLEVEITQTVFGIGEGRNVLGLPDVRAVKTFGDGNHFGGAVTFAITRKMARISNVGVEITSGENSERSGES